jgi:hypothetical protein
MKTLSFAEFLSVANLHRTISATGHPLSSFVQPEALQ